MHCGTYVGLSIYANVYCCADTIPRLRAAIHILCTYVYMTCDRYTLHMPHIYSIALRMLHTLHSFYCEDKLLFICFIQHIA